MPSPKTSLAGVTTRVPVGSGDVGSSEPHAAAEAPRVAVANSDRIAARLSLTKPSWWDKQHDGLGLDTSLASESSVG